MKPLTVVEGSKEAYMAAVRDARDAGWTVVDSWTPPDPRAVCAGTVVSSEDAAAALLAALAGAGLVVHAQSERQITDRLCDDLRRLGRVDHRIGEPPRRPSLTKEERALLDLLLDGRSVAEAARQLNLARRTADRRLASARRKLNVETTAEALAQFVRRSPN